ncbi:hypothetical protein [Clostridium sp.]|uniref:hypothetical protein n=1 Tax=Clostridium sp. TaxID=1506 RepID=UPI0032171D2B
MSENCKNITFSPCEFEKEIDMKIHECSNSSFDIIILILIICIFCNPLGCFFGGFYI